MLSIAFEESCKTRIVKSFPLSKTGTAINPAGIPSDGA
jgi:hypothetical protein